MEKKNGKIVLIIGGNKGLGKEIGRQLGLLGYTVVLTARDKQAGAATVAMPILFNSKLLTLTI